MAPTEGYAAAEATAPTPESAVFDAYRSHLRSALPERLIALQRAVALAAGAIDGPDPEAAFGFLDLADERLQALLSERR